jgi:hypothetical protein
MRGQFAPNCRSEGNGCSGTPVLRVVSGHPANRTPGHRHRPTGNQRLLRTLLSHGKRRILRRGLPQDVLRIARTVAARPGRLHRVLQSRARPPGLSQPRPHAISIFLKRDYTNAPRGGETRSRLVLSARCQTGILPNHGQIGSLDRHAPCDTRTLVTSERHGSSFY